MSNVEINVLQRPKYTRYELSALFKEKRNASNQSIETVSEELKVDDLIIKKIESGKTMLKISEYQIISDFLKISLKDILGNEKDDLVQISYRSNNGNGNIEKIVNEANNLLHEMVMQKKIRAGF